MSDIYYRYENGDKVDEKFSIHLLEFRVIRKTAKGAWISDIWDHDGKFARFVLDGSGKRYAYPTKADARNSFIIRKKRQIQHCENALNSARRCLAIALTSEDIEPGFGHALLSPLVQA